MSSCQKGFSSVPSPQRRLPLQRKPPPPQPPPSSSSEEHLIRKDSSQPGFLFRSFQVSLISEACPWEALPSRKISSIEGFLLRNTSIDAQFSDFFCDILFLPLCQDMFFFNFFYLIIYLLIYFFQDNEANIVLFFFPFSGPCSAATGHKVQKDETFVVQQSHSVHLSAFEFNQASHFLFWFYRHHMLVPSCRPSDDTLHKLINISFRLHSFPVASRTGTTLFCAFKAEESDTAVPKVPKAYGLEKKQTSNQAGQKY